VAGDGGDDQCQEAERAGEEGIAAPASVRIQNVGSRIGVGMRAI
jgi:hypothetical protein